MYLGEVRGHERSACYQLREKAAFVGFSSVHRSSAVFESEGKGRIRDGVPPLWPRDLSVLGISLLERMWTFFQLSPYQTFKVRSDNRITVCFEYV